MRPIPAFLALLFLCQSGCGDASLQSEARSAAQNFESAVTVRERGNLKQAQAYAPAAEMASPEMMGMMGGRAGSEPLPQDAPPVDADISRKIIYDATIELLIEDLDPAADRLVALVESNNAYIAEEEIAGSPGAKRTGRWKLRVPVDRFEDFVRGVIGIGELVRNQRTSQDVTEQFYDMEAQIRNKKVEEETILKILEERSGALEDVLKVQVELSRVRGEIERLEGRIRVLENLSSLATVNLSLREREDYAPPAPVVADFPTRIARAWSASITELKIAGENLVVSIAAFLPKLPFYLVGVVVLFLVGRFAWRRLVRAWPRIWELARRPISTPREST